jgi:hypothetical protein
MRICFPGSATLTFFKNIPTLSSSLIRLYSLLAMLSVVDRALKMRLLGVEPGSILHRAASLAARVNSDFLSRIHVIDILLPLFYRLSITL